VCVYVCVRKVYCGKMADWIRMPFVVVSGVGLGMGVLDAGGDCRTGRGSFEGEFRASHCNQWGLFHALLRTCYYCPVMCVCVHAHAPVCRKQQRTVYCVIYFLNCAIYLQYIKRMPSPREPKGEGPQLQMHRHMSQCPLASDCIVSDSR